MLTHGEAASNRVPDTAYGSGRGRSAARHHGIRLVCVGEFSDCRGGNKAATADLDRPEAAGPDRRIDGRPADSREYGRPIDREQLLGPGVVADGLGTDRVQDRGGQGIRGGSDGGLVIGGQDRPAWGRTRPRESSLRAIRYSSTSSLRRRASSPGSGGTSVIERGDCVARTRNSKH